MLGLKAKFKKITSLSLLFAELSKIESFPI